MKIAFKWIFEKIRKLIKNWGKYQKVENATNLHLLDQYTEYQHTPTKTGLKNLVNLVNFCNHIGINGETEQLKNKILLEWKKITTAKK